MFLRQSVVICWLKLSLSFVSGNSDSATFIYILQMSVFISWCWFIVTIFFLYIFYISLRDCLFLFYVFLLRTWTDNALWIWIRAAIFIPSSPYWHFTQLTQFTRHHTASSQSQSKWNTQTHTHHLISLFTVTAIYGSRINVHKFALKFLDVGSCSSDSDFFFSIKVIQVAVVCTVRTGTAVAKAAWLFMIQICQNVNK